jgi:methionine aminopeptidase
MTYEDERAEAVPVQLPNGAVVKIEIAKSSDTGKEDVAFEMFKFDQIAEILEGVTEAIKGAIEKVKPKKTAVKFGIEVGIESGKLTALIVKGTGKSNLEISMEWGE